MFCTSMGLPKLSDSFCVKCLRKVGNTVTRKHWFNGSEASIYENKIQC